MQITAEQRKEALSLIFSIYKQEARLKEGRLIMKNKYPTMNSSIISHYMGYITELMKETCHFTFSQADTITMLEIVTDAECPQPIKGMEQHFDYMEQFDNSSKGRKKIVKMYIGGI